MPTALPNPAMTGHRSRFDMRTGKVTQGPAKIDLKTFDAAVRDGKILVSTAESRYPDAD